MRAIIDTHVLLWSVTNDKQLLRSWIDILEDPSNDIVLSIASLWEIAIKLSTDKLELRYSLPELAHRFVLGRGLNIMQISVEHLDQIQHLPHHHRDPFDRLIIAQSIAEDLPIMTTDSKFDLYDLKRI